MSTQNSGLGTRLTQLKKGLKNDHGYKFPEPAERYDRKSGQRNDGVTIDLSRFDLARKLFSK